MDFCLLGLVSVCKSNIVFIGYQSGSGNIKETYSFNYDSYGNILNTKVGSQTLCANIYEANNGNLSAVTYGNGSTLNYVYDTSGNRVAIKNAASTWYSWGYNSAGANTYHRDARNNEKYLYTYDSIGRLIRQEIQNNTTLAHKGYTEFGYDIRNNLTKQAVELGGKTVTQRYSYSPISGIAATTDYAKNNLATRYTISGTRYADYTYDSLDRLTSRSFSTTRPIYNNYIYNLSERNSGSATNYRTTRLSTEIVDNDAYRYSYDNLGNITGIEKALRSTGGGISTGTFTAYRSYEYDQLGELTRENDLTSGGTSSWVYDRLGNIVSRKDYAYTTGDLPSAARKEVAYRYESDGTGGWNRRLTGVNLNGDKNADNTPIYGTNETIAYDEIGNPTTYLGANLTWFGRQLTSWNSTENTVIDFSDGVSVPAEITTDLSYKYNADGLRGSKSGSVITNTTDAGTFTEVVDSEYEYVNGQLAHEKRGESDIFFLYDSYGKLTAIRYYATPTATVLNFYVTTNIQGDVLGLYSAAGDLLVKYEYNAWGKILSESIVPNENLDSGEPNALYTIAQTANAINPFRYRGYYYDAETGLYYLSSRYYDPEIGRFINADDENLVTASPMALTDKNLFAYCDNNPVVRVDRGGQFWETVFDVISLGASIVEVCANPTDPWAWAGLVGDTIDLIPFVTGVGEVTRAVKTIDKVSDSVQIAKAVDFTDDAADIIKTLDRSSGFTKSTADAGRKIHQGYKATSNFPKAGKEFREIKGIIPDYIDFKTRTIYELKPMNPRGVRGGIRQLQRYNKALGGGFNLRLELY